MLIVFEGIDGSGKETQINLLKEKLQFQLSTNRQLSVGNEKVSNIRHFKYPTKNFGILNDYLEKKVKLSSKSLFHLFLADIADEQEKISDSESKNKITILDRYVFSTIAYEVDGITYENGKKIVESTNFIKPDLVIYLDLGADISQERKRKQKQLDRYEEDKKYLEQVRGNYLKLYRDKFLTDNWRLVDASKNIDKVHLQIVEALRSSGVKI